MEDKTIFDVCCDLGNATDELKHFVSVGTITEKDIADFTDLKNACIDFITAYEYYIENGC